MSLTAKAYLYRNVKQLPNKYAEPEIRRFGVEEGLATNYEFLEHRVMTIFPNLMGQTIRLYWKDAEGDYVAFSSDDELLDAVSSINDSVFKFYVTAHDGCNSGNKDHADSARHEDSADKPVHPGITCDGCQGEVRGFRYKCLQCPDYDLCRACESKNMHPEHMMLKMVTPTPRPGGFPFPFMFPGGGHRPGRGGFGCWGPGMFGRGRGFHGRPWRRHHCRKGEKTNPESETGEEQRKENENYQQEEGYGTHEEYLSTIGDTVAALLHPLGINVQVDVENEEGQRQRCGEPGNQATSMDTDQESTPQASTTPQPSMDPTPQDGMIATPQTSETGEKTPTQPEKPQEDSAPTAPQPEKPTPSTQPPPVSYPSITPQVNIPPQFDPYRGYAPQVPSPGEGWTMITPNLAYPMQQPMQPMQYPFQPVRPMTADPYERGLAPHIIQALNQMKSMGFTNEGGWLSALLANKEGDIDATLESLKPNITGQGMPNGDRMC